MQLIIDNREPKEIVSILKSRIENVQQENLDIGDFVIRNKNEEKVMLFERKSLSDLIASIKDGRYNEQSFRLNQSEIDNHSIYYIIEGNIMNFCNKNNETLQKMLFSSMLSLSFKKGFSLLHTSGPIETAEFIIRFFDKLKYEKPDNIKNVEIIDKEEAEDESLKYTDVIKSVKKSNITKENINEIMLSCIPGISSNISSALMKEFNSITDLTNKLKENIDCLENFKIKTKDKERKLGKNVINSLKLYLL